MLATRGKPVSLHLKHLTVVEAARREHRRKPEEFYTPVEDMPLRQGRAVLSLAPERLKNIWERYPPFRQW